MSITLDQLQGHGEHVRVVTDAGDKVGTVGQIYLDDRTNTPSWVTVRTGLFGTAETFVPVDGARVDGHDLVVPCSKDLIKDAPRVDADGSLSPEEEQVLYRHYALADGVDAGDAERSEGTQNSGKTANRNRSTQVGDAEITLSEERLRVGTQTHEAGRARLRKHVVTERVAQTVQVRHEEARLVREPLTDADLGGVVPVIGEEVQEVVLHAETPVVEKHVVAVERVRLDTTTVTDQQTVSADVRKEEIELDDPTTTPKTSGDTARKSLNRTKGGKSRR